MPRSGPGKIYKLSYAISYANHLDCSVRTPPSMQELATPQLLITLKTWVGRCKMRRWFVAGGCGAPASTRGEMTNLRRAVFPANGWGLRRIAIGRVIALGALGAAGGALTAALLLGPILPAHLWGLTSPIMGAVAGSVMLGILLR
jgi:hypothetical protein